MDDLPRARVPVAASGSSRQVTPVGSVKRFGRWRLDRDTEVGTIVGSVKLGLQHAEIAAPEVELRVRVEVDGVSVLGSRRVHEDSGSERPDAPVLRLRVDTVVGSVKVYRV